jgi:S-adenosylmethionine hydrolase
MAGPVITLTTDFGTSDAFVGIMKAIILDINPQAHLVDISHDVPPQDILSGAFLFDSAFHYFPPGTIHVLVVDPGVGTGRRPLLVVGPECYFVCPDNGLLSYSYARAGISISQAEPFSSVNVALPPQWRAYHLNNDQFWHHPVSSTFHGRDIFAPTAAYLSRGVPPERMGSAVELVSAFAVPKPHRAGEALVGCVLQVDRFGNLITNIPASALPQPNARIVVAVGGQKVHGLATSYQDGAPLLAIIGSHGYLEIAAANSNAAQILGLRVGDQVSVTV